MINFNSSVDIPVLMYFIDITIENEYGETREIKDYNLYYNLPLDEFYPTHPYKVCRGAYSYLPDEAYEKAYNYSKDKVEDAVRRRFVPKYGYHINSIVIDHYYPYISSVEFDCSLDKKLTLDYDTYKRRPIKTRNEFTDEADKHKGDVRKAIHMIYDKYLFTDALKAQSKMKYCYKSKEFSIEPTAYKLCSEVNGELVLPKNYYEALSNEENIICACGSEVRDSAKGAVVLPIESLAYDNEYQIIVVENNNVYSYTPIIALELETNIDGVALDLPLAEKRILSENERREFAMQALQACKNRGVSNPTALVMLAEMLK